MNDDPSSMTLAQLFGRAMQLSSEVENSHHPTISEEYQQVARRAHHDMSECLRRVQMAQLFSDNEELEELSTESIRYLVVRYHVADLLLKLTGRARSQQLRQAQAYLHQFLQEVGSYGLLHQEDSRALGDRAPRDVGAKREMKIERKKREREARERLHEVLKLLSKGNEEGEEEADDDELLREHGMLLVQGAARAAIDSQGLIEMELELLKHADEIDHRPGEGPPVPQEEVEVPPMKTFTINSKEEARSMLFKERSNMPTMSVEEFGDQEMAQMREKDEEKQAIVQAYVEEQARITGLQGLDLEAELKMPGEEESDEETDEKQMKARNWDDWMDENPRERYRSISGR